MWLHLCISENRVLWQVLLVTLLKYPRGNELVLLLAVEIESLPEEVCDGNFSFLFYNHICSTYSGRHIVSQNYIDLWMVHLSIF